MTRQVYAFIILLVFLVFGYFYYTKEVNATLTAVLTGTVSYVTGSSVGSKKKDDIIADIAKNGTNTPQSNA